MYLANIFIENFRGFGPEKDNRHLSLALSPGLNMLVGENDSGKSSIVDAVRLVLATRTQEGQRITDDDFHVVGKDRVPTFTRTQVLISREHHAAHCAILDGLKHIVECFEGGRLSRHHFRERMRDGRLNESRIRKSIVRLLCGNSLTAETWPKAMTHLRGLLLPGGRWQARSWIATWR